MTKAIKDDEPVVDLTQLAADIKKLTASLAEDTIKLAAMKAELRAAWLDVMDGEPPPGETRPADDDLISGYAVRSSRTFAPAPLEQEDYPGVPAEHLPPSSEAKATFAVPSQFPHQAQRGHKLVDDPPVAKEPVLTMTKLSRDGGFSVIPPNEV